MIKSLSCKVVILSMVVSFSANAAQEMSPVDFGARLEPPAGRVIHGWGQISGFWNWDDPVAEKDVDDLDAYLKAVAPHQPAMISFYVAPVEEQVGRFLNKYRAFVKSRGFFIAQVGLYFMDEFLHRRVAEGEADGYLQELLRGLQDAGNPVLLRVGYEFNNHWTPYDPVLYGRAYKRVVDLIKQTKASNIATVWHAEPAGFPDRDYHDWYPGDDQVDWWGLSLFHQEHMSDPNTVAFLEEAYRRRKPVLLAECSPWFHGTESAPLRAPDSLEEASGWYQELFGITKRYPHVKVVSVIVVDWTRWNTKWSQIPGGLPNVRFELWPSLDNKYRSWIGEDRFIHVKEAVRLYGIPNKKN